MQGVAMSGIIPYDTTTYRVTGLAADTKYYFTVTAVDAEENESVCNVKPIKVVPHTQELAS